MSNEPTTLAGKTVLITGASSGIGCACAIRAGQMGANLVLVARNQKRLEKTQAASGGSKNIAFSCDVTDYAHLMDIVKESVNQLGPIGGFIHAAGVEATAPLRTTTPSTYHELFSVNVVAGFELARILSDSSCNPAENGSYVFIGSVMGVVGAAGKTAYCSSKGALIAGTKAIALELARRRIRVNCVVPGLVQTAMSERMLQGLPQQSRDKIIEMHPLGIGAPEDVAHACVFLLSDATRWITGTALFVDGGYTAQ